MVSYRERRKGERKDLENIYIERMGKGIILMVNKYVVKKKSACVVHHHYNPEAFQ